MAEPAPKTRGPLLWLASRSRWYWCGGMITLPLAYIVSLPVLFWMHRQFGIFPARTLAGKAFYWYLWPVRFVDGWLPPEAHEQLWRFLLTLTH